MNHTVRKIGLIAFAYALLSTLSLPHSTMAAERPNILWISCEDISPNLGCYGDPHAVTPNLDKLASEGVRFTRAFTPAGVCAVVRSGLITGMYAPAVRSQHMRSQIVPPPEVRCFPELLREAGYFCTNRDKTDYQFASPESVWDRQGKNHQDWRDRRKTDQPFFSVINLTCTHESQVRHGKKAHEKVLRQIGDSAHDPAKIYDTMPPYFPDTPAARQDWAWYQDNITLMDKLVGDLLQKLDDDGLAESTIVVFWSDHGMGLPRGKRWIYDSGTHIPLIVRWPQQIDAGTVREDLVSILDLPPTMLALAKAPIPHHMHGRILIGGRAAEEPAYLFFHRDRMDETSELQRGARDRRWRYIRNYEPEKPYSQPIAYMDQMPTMIDWRLAAKEGRLTPAQSHWFTATKPIEELYDTLEDPWEIDNLAGQAQYAERLQRMREATEAWQEQINDSGLVPEAVMMEEMSPEGKQHTTDDVQINLYAGEIDMNCPTDGSSIIYRTAKSKARDAGWSDWKLYLKPLNDRQVAKVQAKANRLGYRDGKVTEWQAPH